MEKLWLAVIVFASGCNFLRSDLPVRLTFDEEIPVDRRAQLTQSAQIWNRCGAAILDVGEEAPEVQTVRVQLGTPSFGNWAQYDFVPRTITLMPFLVDWRKADPGFAAVAVAHELGHGFGLNHVASETAIMQQNNHSGLALEAEDAAEWLRATGMGCD